MIHGLAALIVGVYLLAVALRGNGTELAGKLGEDKGFIPWAIAFVVLWLLWRNQSTRTVGGALLTLALLAFLLQAGSTLFENFDAVMAKLKGK